MDGMGPNDKATLFWVSGVESPGGQERVDDHQISRDDLQRWWGPTWLR